MGEISEITHLDNIAGLERLTSTEYNKEGEIWKSKGSKAFAPFYIVRIVSVLMGDLAILEILLTGEKHVLEGKRPCEWSKVSVQNFFWHLR